MLYQRHPRSSPPEWSLEQSPGSYDTHSIGRCQVGAIYHLPKGLIATRLHYELRVDRTHLVQPSGLLVQERLDSLDRPRFVTIVYANPKDAHTAQ